MTTTTDDSIVNTTTDHENGLSEKKDHENELSEKKEEAVIDANTTKKKGKKTERKLRTRNVLMIKKLIDSPEEESDIQLVGTIIQQVFDLTEEEHKGTNFEFDYRFNENTASAETGNLYKRRSEPLITSDSTGKEILGVRNTYQTQIPLIVETLYSAFPFRIVTATATIELSSPNLGTGTLRPDLLLHTVDPRNNISIQALKPSCQQALLANATGGERYKKKIPDDVCELTERILDKLDCTKKYDFISPYPKVYVEYEKKKEYAPRFVLSFYCITSGFAKIVSIVLPMILITFMTFVNVMNDVMTEEIDDAEIIKGEEVSSHLQVMSVLTLSTVFILPKILDPSNRNDIFSQSNIYVILVFLSLILTSLPRRFAGTAAYEICGFVIMLLSLFIPVVNSFYYYRIVKRLQNESYSNTKNNTFLAGNNRHWKESDGLEDFATAAELLKPQNLQKYQDIYMIRPEEEDVENKNRRLWWSDYYSVDGKESFAAWWYSLA